MLLYRLGRIFFLPVFFVAVILRLFIPSDGLAIALEEEFQQETFNRDKKILAQFNKRHPPPTRGKPAPLLSQKTTRFPGKAPGSLREPPPRFHGPRPSAGYKAIPPPQPNSIRPWAKQTAPIPAQGGGPEEGINPVHQFPSEPSSTPSYKPTPPAPTQGGEPEEGINSVHQFPSEPSSTPSYKPVPPAPKDKTASPLLSHTTASSKKTSSKTSSKDPQPSKTANQRNTLIDSSPPKIPLRWIIPSLLFGIAVGYLLKKFFFKPHTFFPVLFLRQDMGSQRIESLTPVLSNMEVRFRPVIDPGKQNIQAVGSLMIDKGEK